MADEAHEQISVAAPPDRSWAVATDYERYPEWAKDVKYAAVLERDSQGRGKLVEYRVAGLGRSIRYVLAYDYDEEPAAFSWALVEGDVLRRLDGRYGFEAEGPGTRVSYDLVVDVAIPLPGLIKRRAAGMIVGTALRELKKEAESMSEPLHDLHDNTESESEPMTEPLRDVSDNTSPAAEASGEVGNESEPGLPPPSAIESLVSALLEAAPEVAEHVVRAAQELLLAAQCVVDAAGKAVHEQQDARRDDADDDDAEADDEQAGGDAPRHLDLAE
ncbi:MAG: SRPBCC family protein [Acidimicrobiia bacterium]